MLCVVAPVLQVLPAVALDVNTMLSPWQKLVAPLALITGADGIDIGAAIPIAGLLVQPLGIVCVTLYVPGVVTVIDGVDTPVSFHNKDPA